MKKECTRLARCRSHLRFALFFALLLPAHAAWAALNVFATVPEWGALAKEIGGNQVEVFTATHALQDPHRIEAKPSLLARARQADLLLATGADLEIGWLPVVQREAGNSKIQTGQAGFFEAANFVPRLDVPAVVDRAHGDVHPGGNPHIQLDPRNFLKIGEALSKRLAQLDPTHAATYQGNYTAFAEKWKAAISRWEKQAAPLKGVPVLVHHKSFTYLTTWLGIKEVGALEPKPGVEPSSSHLANLVAQQQSQPAKMVLRAAYQNDGPSKWISSKTGIQSVMLPYKVGGTPEANSLFGLFDDTLNRLLKGL